MSVSAPASWSKSQNPYRTTPARRQRRHLVSLRDVRSQTPLVTGSGGGGGGGGGGAGLPSASASPPSGAATPLCRRARELSDIDPKYVSQSGLCLSSDMETSRGSIRIQHLTGPRPPVGEPRFPKLEECAHFHYEVVELGPLLVQLYDEELKSASHSSEEESAGYLSLQVTSFGRSWVLRRSYDNLRLLDSQLHKCIYDRKYSCLPELPLEENLEPLDDSLEEAVEALVADYLHRFSQIAGPLINCAPILNWFELDNRGNRLLVADDSDINTPAVAAALVGKRYVAQASDEISLEVGDMISVIDMAPPDESIWWRGKRGFEVGFFPCECVQLIGEKVPQQLALPPRPRRAATLQPSRPVLRKHGKLIAFFRSFIQTRPSRRKLKQSGILKERVFGCDLGEHLMNSGRDIPVVLRSCAEFIEAHGIVDGIYRLSGVNSNIQRLRNTFDEDRVPDLTDPSVRQDIHSVSCLLKQYLRELPNPLLTYQLYDKFVAAVQSGDDQRLLRMRDVVQQLPPPHYRTLEYLIRHLSRVSAHGHSTGMTPKNLAIVWAPNLVRSKELEVGGVAALQGVGIQAVVVEYLIRYCELIFSDKLPAFCPDLAPQTRTPKRSRPKSLAISTPTKLLSLEEARSRALGVSAKADQKYIEVGGGPATLPTKYHTVIELPQRKSGSLKFRRSPLGWKSLFRGRPAKNHQRKGSEPIDIALTDKTLTESDLTQSRVKTRRLRSVKSADSLVSMCHAESKRESMMMDSSPSPGTLPASAPAAEPLRSCSESDTPETDPAVRAHARSVSHDSYFNNLLELKLPFCDDRLEEEDEELQTQYCFDDSDMRVFSEDDTMRASDSAGWRGRFRQLTSPPRVRRASRSAEDAGGVKRTAPGSFREKVLSALSPGARRRAEEAAADAGLSPRVKVRKKASIETLTCSESTSVDVSSLRTDGSTPATFSGEAGEAAAPPPPPAPPAGRQVVAEVHVSPEPSTCQDIILLSPISECTASSAEQYGRPAAPGSPGDDEVTERDVSEIRDSDGELTPAGADSNRISTLVPEALELLDRRLNSERFRRAVAADAERAPDDDGPLDADDDDAAYENVTPAAEAPPGPDAEYEPVEFAASERRASAEAYENEAFAAAAEVPVSADAAAGDDDERVYENVEAPPARDADVYQQVRVFQHSLEEVNAMLSAEPASPPQTALLSARRSYVEAAAPAADGGSPTRSCPAFSDGGSTPSPTDMRYSQLSSAPSTPERAAPAAGRPDSADITTAATCSDTLDERPLPSETEPLSAAAAAAAGEPARPVPSPPRTVGGGDAASPAPPEPPPRSVVLREPLSPVPAAGREPTGPPPIAASPARGAAETAARDGRPAPEAAAPLNLEDRPCAEQDGPMYHELVATPEDLAQCWSEQAAGDLIGPLAARPDSPAYSPVTPASRMDSDVFLSGPVSEDLPADDLAALPEDLVNHSPVSRESPPAGPLAASPEDLYIQGACAASGVSAISGAASQREDLPVPLSPTSPGDLLAFEPPSAQDVFSPSPLPPPHEEALLELSLSPSVGALGLSLAAEGAEEGEESASAAAAEARLFPAECTPPPPASDAVPSPAEVMAPLAEASAPQIRPGVVDCEIGPRSSLDMGLVEALVTARPVAVVFDGPAVSSPRRESPELGQEAAVCQEMAEPQSPADRPAGRRPAGAGTSPPARTPPAAGPTSPTTPTMPLSPEEAAGGRPSPPAQNVTVHSPAGGGRSAPVSIPGSEPEGAERRARAGGRAAASWPGPAAGGGAARPSEPAPAWLRSDLRRLSDRRASVKQLLSKFEVKEEDEASVAETAAGDAPQPPPPRPAPEPEPVTRKTSLPERPRYLFTPKPFQRQMSDQTAARPRPESAHSGPLSSPAAVHITANPLHAAAERLARAPAVAAATPAVATEVTLRYGESGSRPGEAQSRNSEPVLRHGEAPARSGDPVARHSEPTMRLAEPAGRRADSAARNGDPASRHSAPPTRSNGLPAAAEPEPGRPAARPAPLGPLRVGSVPSQELRVGSVPSRPAPDEEVRSAGPSRAERGPSAEPAADDVFEPSQLEVREMQQSQAGVVEGRLVIGLDPTARERIERYKQERRSLLREKYKTESFKREKTEVLLDRRRPTDAGERRRTDSQSPSPTRRGEPLRRSDSEAASPAERRAALASASASAAAAPPAAATQFRRTASLRSPGSESAPAAAAAAASAAAATTTATASVAASGAVDVNERLAAARERVSQLRGQPAPARDPTEDVNVREQVAGWSRTQRPAPQRAAAAAAAARSQAADPGKIRNIAAKFEDATESARKTNYVSTV